MKRNYFLLVLLSLIVGHESHSQVISLKEFYSSKANQQELLKQTHNSEEKVFLQQFFSNINYTKAKAYVYRGQLIFQPSGSKEIHRIVPIVVKRFYNVDGRFVSISKKSVSSEDIARELVSNFQYNKKKESFISVFVNKAQASLVGDELFVRLYVDSLGHVMVRNFRGFHGDSIFNDENSYDIEIISKRVNVNKYFDQLGARIECHKDQIIAKGRRLSDYTFKHNRSDHFSTLVMDDVFLKINHFSPQEIKPDKLMYNICFRSINSRQKPSKELVIVIESIEKECRNQKLEMTSCFYDKVENEKAKNQLLREFVENSDCYYNHVDLDLSDIRAIESCDQDFKNCKPVESEQLKKINNKRSVIKNWFQQSVVGGTTDDLTRKELSYASSALMFAATCCDNTECKENLKEKVGTELYEDIESSPSRSAN